MAFDNFTIRTLRALQECPQGQRPGEIFEATQDAADILVKVGCAEFADEDPVAEPAKGKYKRRDLRAEP